ncbi:DUF3592 domain-containing protein [Rickettsiales bacterium]|nr:DUF3592 domain-containing protein [Rickettsiales bacterium]
MEEILNDSGKIIFLCLCFAILSEMAVGIFLFIRTQSFMARAITAMAKIKDVKTYRSQNGTYTKLSVEYKDGLGSEYEKQVTGSKDNQIGEEVEILYDPENPEKVKANNKFQIFIIPCAMMAGSLMLVVILFALISQGVAKLPF